MWDICSNTIQFPPLRMITLDSDSSGRKKGIQSTQRTVDWTYRAKYSTKSSSISKTTSVFYVSPNSLLFILFKTRTQNTTVNLGSPWHFFLHSHKIFHIDKINKGTRRLPIVAIARWVIPRLLPLARCVRHYNIRIALTRSWCIVVRIHLAQIGGEQPLVSHWISGGLFTNWHWLL